MKICESCRKRRELIKVKVRHFTTDPIEETIHDWCEKCIQIHSLHRSLATFRINKEGNMEKVSKKLF